MSAYDRAYRNELNAIDKVLYDAVPHPTDADLDEEADSYRCNLMCCGVTTVVLIVLAVVGFVPDHAIPGRDFVVMGALFAFFAWLPGVTFVAYIGDYYQLWQRQRIRDASTAGSEEPEAESL